MTVETVHRIEGATQVTKRVVTVSDAIGQEFSHEFVVDGDDSDPDDHRYAGDGEPPESAVVALREFLDAGEGDDD